MSVLVGLTGCMGAGKSLAASFFLEQGACIIDADAICRELVKPGKPAWKEIFDTFGSEYFNPDDSLNRKKLAALIFENNNKRIALEAILHHRVIVEEKVRYHSYQKLYSNAVVIIDSALLIESGNYKTTDRVIVIDSNEEVQIERVMKRSSESRETVKKRLEQQMPLEEKLKYADYVLYNKSDQEYLKTQVFDLYLELLKLS
jgi:dephospho-CoA kinase